MARNIVVIKHLKEEEVLGILNAVSIYPLSHSDLSNGLYDIYSNSEDRFAS